MMADLEIGDAVRTHDGSFSKVLLFSKRLADREAEFFVLHLESGATLELTKNHYTYFADGQLVLAKDVKVGDRLSAGEVVEVTQATYVGAYSPVTAAGELLVNGVRVSSHTRKVDPSVAQVALAPRRALVALGIKPEWLNRGCTRGCDYEVRLLKNMKKAFKSMGLTTLQGLIQK